MGWRWFGNKQFHAEMVLLYFIYKDALLVRITSSRNEASNGKTTSSHLLME